MRTKYKAWTKPFLEEHREVQLDRDEVKSLSDYYLEIGSGKGQFLLDMALKNPTLNFVGIEKNITCAGFTAKKLVDAEIKNAKIIFDDADYVVDNIHELSVDGIFLNFSDPWPKKRHHKRRLTSESFLNRYFSILKVGGKLIIKTDNVDLFEYSKELMANSKFEILRIDDDYDGLDPFDTCTEYEKSFRLENVKIHRMVVVKND